MTNSPDYPNAAVLQIRSSVPGESPRQIPCRFDSILNRRLTLISGDPVRVSTPVSMEYNDTMLLGEVVACTQDCDQNFHLELRVEQVLTGLQSLMLLRERLLGESKTLRVDALAATARHS